MDRLEKKREAPPCVGLRGMSMEVFAIGLFAAAVIGIPMAILLCNDYGKKRGCGRGCSTCGNRHICHPDRYSTPGTVMRPPRQG